MKEYEFIGKSVEAAVEEGLKSLNLSKEEAEITVLEEGKKGLFKSTPAKVKICKKMTDGERAVEFLDGIMELLNIPATNELVENEENPKITVITTSTYSVIGHRGEILDSLQVLAGAVANIGREEYKRVVVDCENYREKREDTLKRLAQKLAEKAVRTGRKVSIEPMSPYERRIIHSALSESTEVKTVSEGKEPNRFIVIVPNNLRPGADRPFRSDRRDNRGRDDRRFNRDRRDDRRDFRGRDDNRGEGRDNRDFRGRDDRRGGDRRDRGPRPEGRPQAKRAPFFGTYLGNSNKTADDAAPEKRDEE